MNINGMMITENLTDAEKDFDRTFFMDISYP